MIELKTRTYYELTAKELNDLIEQFFDRKYDVYRNEDVGYNAIVVFDVSDRLTRFEMTDIANFNGRKFVPNVTRALLNQLAEQGHIPAGRYIVTSAL